MSLPAERHDGNIVHPGNFRHDLLLQTDLPIDWQELYMSLILQAEVQVRVLFGSTVLHTMLIERAAYLFVLQKMSENTRPELADEEWTKNYNALLRQFLKVTDQLSKYEVPNQVKPENAFLYTVMEVVDKEIEDPGTKRRVAERLLELRK